MVFNEQYSTNWYCLCYLDILLSKLVFLLYFWVYISNQLVFKGKYHTTCLAFTLFTLISLAALILSRLRSAYLPRVNIIRSAACLPDWLRSLVSETERLQWNWQADSRDGGQTKCALWRAWRRHRCLGPFTFDSGQKQKKGVGLRVVAAVCVWCGEVWEWLWKRVGGFCQSVSSQSFTH